MFSQVKNVIQFAENEIYLIHNELFVIAVFCIFKILSQTGGPPVHPILNPHMDGNMEILIYRQLLILCRIILIILMLKGF